MTQSSKNTSLSSTTKGQTQGKTQGQTEDQTRSQIQNDTQEEPRPDISDEDPTIDNISSPNTPPDKTLSDKGTLSPPAKQSGRSLEEIQYDHENENMQVNVVKGIIQG